jgi:hypothetical protein
MRQVLSWALARSPGLRSLAWARLAVFCDSGLFFPLYGADVVAGAVVALVREHDQPGGGQLPHDAPDPGGVQVVHRTRKRAGHPQDPAVRAGDDLQVHPVAAVLAGAGRPVRGDPVDGN